MKKQLPDKQYTISDFQFSIYPKYLTFHSNSSQLYTLYFQKGAQVIGKFEQIANSQKSKFVFEVVQRKDFRIFNDKAVTYQWSIYKLIDRDQKQQFLQSSVFSVQKSYSTYIGYFNQAQNQLRKNYKSKQNQKIQQIWKTIKKMVQQQTYSLSCLFKNSQILLQFQCEIKCQYDHMLRDYEARKLQIVKFKEEKMRRKESQSMDSRLINDSRMNDSRIKSSQLSFDSKRQQKVFSDNKKQNSKKQEDKNKQSPIKQMNQDVRQSQIQIFDPEGAKIDLQSSEGQRVRLSKSSQDYTDYDRKRNSLLSDIIEQSYEGSSNINASKSTGEQKLKSIDAINQQNNESPFSPVVRTQTFESEKFQEIINFKRTATLRHKTSKDYNYPLEQHKQEVSDELSQQEYLKHTHTEDEMQQYVENVYTQKIKARKKLILILFLIIIFTSLIGVVYYKSNSKRIIKATSSKLKIEQNAQKRSNSLKKPKRSQSRRK